MDLSLATIMPGKDENQNLNKFKDPGSLYVMRNGHYSKDGTNDTPFGKGFASVRKILHSG
jgi:hypothetical protein